MMVMLIIMVMVMLINGGNDDGDDGEGDGDDVDVAIYPGGHAGVCLEDNGSTPGKDDDDVNIFLK